MYNLIIQINNTEKNEQHNIILDNIENKMIAKTVANSIKNLYEAIKNE